VGKKPRHDPFEPRLYVFFVARVTIDMQSAVTVVGHATTGPCFRLTSRKYKLVFLINKKRMGLRVACAKMHAMHCASLDSGSNLTPVDKALIDKRVQCTPCGHEALYCNRDGLDSVLWYQAARGLRDARNALASWCELFKVLAERHGPFYPQ
jgi:hypothetical protein